MDLLWPRTVYRGGATATANATSLLVRPLCRLLRECSTPSSLLLHLIVMGTSTETAKSVSTRSSEWSQRGARTMLTQTSTTTASSTRTTFCLSSPPGVPAHNPRHNGCGRGMSHAGLICYKECHDMGVYPRCGIHCVLGMLVHCHNAISRSCS